ncbi:MAG TPA: hypothetical protein VES20_19980 [Bryobacteraceae bacterium]|nr:hypothetical protein [Bryobacteraceae bacterium]
MSCGLKACRDGVRWHLIETVPGEYCFESLRSQVDASRRTGMQIIWDLCHYGWPDGLDIFSPEFVDRFARMSRATARLLGSELPGPYWFTPVNEISFFSWAAGEHALFGPFERGRGFELKCQLIRASIAAIEAIRDEIPSARFVQPDPLIHIVPAADASAAARSEADGYCTAQYQAWDMLVGAVCPELGGHPRYLDIVGCNYYVHNQWVYPGGPVLDRTDTRYRPLWQMLAAVCNRYKRPLFLAETGIEDDLRPEWLAYICDEVEKAVLNGVPVEGICLYPVVNHPGWADDRHCHNGLWDYCNNSGDRTIYNPLANELARQQQRFGALQETLLACSAERAVTFA